MAPIMLREGLGAGRGHPHPHSSPVNFVILFYNSKCHTRFQEGNPGAEEAQAPRPTFSGIL